MRSIYLIKLELLLDPKIRIERINLFELQLNLLIMLNLSFRLQSKLIRKKLKLFLLLR
jgi:hypothetical protein